MFDTKAFYASFNAEVQAEYELSLNKVKRILKETEDSGETAPNKEIIKFFNHTANVILEISDFEKKISNDYLSSKTLEQLLSENNQFYTEMLPENYETSYANTVFSVKVFGDKLGQLLSYFYSKTRQLMSLAYYHQIFILFKHINLFIKAFEIVKVQPLEYEKLSKCITDYEREDKTALNVLRLKEQFSTEFRYFSEIIENADFNDVRYLFKFPAYISENEIKTAKFFANYPEDKIKKLSKLMVEAYINGFTRDNKDLSKKSTVRVSYNVGQERLVRQLISDFERKNLKVLISYAVSTAFNKQYLYDHKFDMALYFDKEFIEKSVLEQEKSCEECKKILSDLSGSIFFDKFGEIPFIPVDKKENLKFSEEQSKLYREHNNKLAQLYDKYLPRSETSFSIIAFPSPEIKDNFEQIFEATCEINMLDNAKYSRIQQHIIDALDKGNYVHIKGKGSNLTDIKIKLHELKKPKKETNFVNCVADVNIPVGEVFTSPELAGTFGVLHVSDAYLGRYNYKELKLTFKDGYITEYSCKNYDDEAKNKKFIEENLLFPHKTLPIGEFAIGTNTLAYVFAKKFNIVKILTPLIIEKMGPHFAIGDTCFSWTEDMPVFNPDKKEMIARENEKSVLRKKDVNQAYTNKHIDITLPFDDIEFITSIVNNKNKLDIIKNGRFVLKGTEELNEPFKTNP
ncbi:MAG: aminopeptidase [bacterium]|nr:aminopeptidase [bacterium]